MMRPSNVEGDSVCGSCTAASTSCSHTGVKSKKLPFTPLLYLATHARPYPTGSVAVRRHRFYLTNESQLTNKHALDPSHRKKKKVTHQCSSTREQSKSTEKR